VWWFAFPSTNKAIQILKKQIKTFRIKIWKHKISLHIKFSLYIAKKLLWFFHKNTYKIFKKIVLRIHPLEDFQFTITILWGFPKTSIQNKGPSIKDVMQCWPILYPLIPSLVRKSQTPLNRTSQTATYLMRAYCVGVVLLHRHVIYANWAWEE
jgi:hypothetical protein